jgi:hypothetical protein
MCAAVADQGERTELGMASQKSVTAVAAVLVLLGANAAEAIDRRVRIVNESKHDIVEFFGVNAGAETGENMLGNDDVPAGGSTILSFDDGSGYCRFKFRAVFADGVELVRENVNICEVGTYRYTD